MSTLFSLRGVKISEKLSQGIWEGLIIDLSFGPCLWCSLLDPDPSCLDCVFSLASWELSYMFLSSPLTWHSALFMASSMLAVGFYDNDSMKWPAFSLFWKAPTNISWFGWETFMVSSLNLAKYSRRYSEVPSRTLNKLVVVTSLCLLVEKCCTIFLIRSW